MTYGRAMTAGAPWRHILRFAFPVLAGSLLQHLYSLVDQIIVGNFAGQDELAAIGTTVTFTLFFLALAIGFSAGSGVLVSQFYGAQDDANVRSASSVGVLLLLGFGAVSTGVGILVARPAFDYFVDAPDEILDLTVKYFTVYMYGLIFQFGFNIFAANLRAVGDSASTLYFLVVSSIVNIVLDLLFVGQFRWGVVGAAAATDVAQAVSCAVAYVYMIRRYPIFHIRLREYRWDWRVAQRIVELGFPIALHMVVIAVGTTVIQRAVNGYGKIMTASFAVGRQLELFLNFPSHALQTTLATFTGQNVGAKRLDRVKLGGRQTTVISITFTVFISIFLWIFAPQIVNFFGLDAEAGSYCTRHVRAITVINIVLCSYLPLFGLFQGTGHGAIPAFVATVALTLRCLSMYLFGHGPFLGYTIVWWNGIFGFGVGCFISWSYYLSGRWRRGLDADAGPQETE